jgi:hypothetical protein
MGSNSLDLEDLVVIFSYLAFTVFLFLSFLQQFNRLAVFIMVGFFILAILLLKKRIRITKKYFWLFLLVPIIVAGFGFLRGTFPGDCYSQWLIAAKNIATSGTIPAFIIADYFSRPPLSVIFYAATFLLFNSFNELILIWVPLFFTTATLIVIMKWALLKELDKKLLFVLPLLFLTNPEVLSFSGWSLLQEAVLLFFATCSFFYYEKYLSSKNRFNLFLMITSFALVAASKESGLFLLLFMIPITWLKSRDKKRFVIYTLILFAPVFAWLLRNYLIFGNPVFAVLNNVFGGPYAEYYAQATNLTPTPPHLQSLSAKYLYTIKNLWLAFPFVILSLYGLIKERRFEYLLILGLYFLSKEYLLFTITSVIRYYYLFLGPLLVYGALGLKNLKSKVVIAGLIILAWWGLFKVPIIDSSSSFISSIEGKLWWLKNIPMFIKSYQFFVLIGLALILFFIKKEKTKLFLVGLYALYFLHVEYVFNKSWLNSWLVILGALILLPFFVNIVKFKTAKVILTAVILLVVILESWGLGSIYVFRHGFSWPVSYVYKNSNWAGRVLDKQDFDPKANYILIAAQHDYFNWFTNYQTVTFGKFDFNRVTDLGYQAELSSQQVKDLFIKSKIKYVVYNDDENEKFSEFYDKITTDNPFELIAESEKDYKIFKVY